MIIQFDYQKPRCSDEVSVQVKLEATKRKLQERYQQAENGVFLYLFFSNVGQPLTLSLCNLEV